ncbi:tRNA pseudouridine(38-40) synthase TruA [Daejeonella sp.]|uniref:tRNA pseudouridine(38-40) synthase TruA n=1 Tax=Daejeonella sp. TaxID=2805397 RepID=UPI003784A624
MNALQRYFIEIAYNGTAYHGWQIQKNAVSVQELVNKVLSTLCRQDIETLGCGRTDTGVHASQLFAHVDIPEEIDVFNQAFLQRSNSMLPNDIALKRFIKVNPDAHARFDATLRSYEYHIHFSKNPFLHNLSWQLRERPNIDLMNQAAEILMEYRDFSCFSKSNTKTLTNNCLINRAEWVQTEDGIVFHISADRFLRNMVRAIVGTLLRVGKQEMKVEEIRNVIDSKDRSNAGESVPACGLYLTEVIYPYLP